MKKSINEYIKRGELAMSFYVQITQPFWILSPVPFHHIYLSWQEYNHPLKFSTMWSRSKFLVLLKDVMELYLHIFVLASIDSEKFPEPTLVKAATRIE